MHTFEGLPRYADHLLGLAAHAQNAAEEARVSDLPNPEGGVAQREGGYKLSSVVESHRSNRGLVALKHPPFDCSAQVLNKNLPFVCSDREFLRRLGLFGEKFH